MESKGVESVPEVIQFLFALCLLKTSKEVMLW